MTNDPSRDGVSAERRLARLADERTTLFARAGTVNGLSKDDHARLGAIERQIDECFLEIRRNRAARDADRFTAETHVIRRGLRPPSRDV
jgi:hypothetical protein